MNRYASADTPATEDSLGRKDIATGLASLFLNPCIVSPVVVGLSGASGLGKSSLMIQVERILLQTAAQLLFPNLWLTTEAESIGESSTALLHQGRVLHDTVKKKATQWMKTEGAENKKAMEREAKKFLMDDKLKDEFDTTLGDIVASWIYAWRRNKANLLLRLFFPILLAAFLAPWIGWGVWILMSRSKSDELQKFRYGSIPVSVIVILWTIMHHLLGTVSNVSDQIDKYVLKAGSHNVEKLGYQQSVIEDIQMMMKLMGKYPFCLWTMMEMMARCFSTMWKVVEYCYFTIFDRGRDKDESPELNLKFVKSSSKDKLRVIVFVDNLDKCPPQNVFEILSAIHLILAECKINVVLGTDMNTVKKAIKSSFIQANYKGVKIPQDIPKIYGDKELEAETDKYLQKIFQLPLDLPDPSKVDFRNFLDRQLLGVQSKANPVQPASSMTQQNVSSRNQGQQASSSQHQSPSVADQSHSHNRDLEEGSTHGECHQEDTKEKNPTKLNLLVSTDVMLLPDYTESEKVAFRGLGGLVAMNETNPREWKRLLLYYKLVWNILSQNRKVTKLRGWELQLVMWVFVCWRWKEEMDYIIQREDLSQSSRTDCAGMGESMITETPEQRVKEEERRKRRQWEEFLNAFKKLRELDVEEDLIASRSFCHFQIGTLPIPPKENKKTEYRQLSWATDSQSSTAVDNSNKVGVIYNRQ
eukprot:Gb_01062 [translate_table: standard]